MIRRPITYISEFAEVVGFIIRLAKPVCRQISMLSHVNGELDADGAEAVGLEVSQSMGDLQVNIKGVDVLDAEAQELLSRGIARLTYSIIRAVRLGRTS
tara:strand:+ start:580 stop:876 length:297 start_codon:yes stop_codon:yes gene_type:complete